MKRQRGRGRKPGGGGGGNPGNRSLESNGPEVKIRGTAAQIFEKYSQYARDAQSSGDRVKYENYLQHAEHYFRIMAATMPREQRMQQAENGGSFNGGGDGERESEEVQADALKVVDEAADEGDDDARESGGEAEAREDDGDNAEARAQGGEDRGEGGRSRRRRNRRRNNDGGGQGADGEGGDTEARSALDALAHKQAAVAGN
ncbi:MAG: DUF4167 domain-containing protein [Alphaproteobacteria bacterium]|nr:DUF4167 domain-containing protein [Alphaproteobacteria bacterium]